MLDFELQERLKQHKTDPAHSRSRVILIALIFLAVGVLAGIASTYSYHRFSRTPFEAELNLMIVLAAESQNLDPAATVKAVENAVGKPMGQFSERDALAAFKFLVANTKRN